MRNLTATDITLILTCFFTGICSIIAAIKANKSSNTNESNSNKLDVIHQQTNGNLSEQKAKLEELNRKYERAQRIIMELANEAPPGSLGKVKTRVDDSLDVVRSGDFNKE